MKRRLLACTLLTVMPFGGMRVICLDTPMELRPVTASAEDDCERLCVMHHSTSSGDSDCSMTADPSSMTVVATAAVVPAGEDLWAPPVVFHRSTELPFLYLDPGLAQLNPPPKAALL